MKPYAGKDSSGKWTAQVVNAVLAGKQEPALDEHIEELLRWLANAQTPDVEAISAEFRKRDVGSEEARQLTLALLDRALFETSSAPDPNRVLGIAPGASREVIRARYHRLIQVYHPDRNQGDPAWLNNRTERLNWAYSYLKKNAHKPIPPDQAEQVGAKVTPVRSTRTPDKDFRDAYPDKGGTIRSYLGSSAQFQRRFLISLILIATGLLGYFYLTNV